MPRLIPALAKWPLTENRDALIGEIAAGGVLRLLAQGHGNIKWHRIANHQASGVTYLRETLDRALVNRRRWRGNRPPQNRRQARHHQWRRIRRHGGMRWKLGEANWRLGAAEGAGLI